MVADAADGPRGLRAEACRWRPAENEGNHGVEDGAPCPEARGGAHKNNAKQVIYRTGMGCAAGMEKKQVNPHHLIINVYCPDYTHKPAVEEQARCSVTRV
jgi:hypothetical protein